MDLGVLDYEPWTIEHWSLNCRTVKTKVDEMIKKRFDQRRVTQGMTFVTSKTKHYSHKMDNLSTWINKGLIRINKD